MPSSPMPLPKRAEELAADLGLLDEELIPYGRYKGKIALAALDRLRGRPLGRYVLVTAINPTPLGEGKTVTAIGLAMGLCRLGLRALVTLRQPSLGPVFGIKGGGSGGGRAQVIPQEEVNLHLTGDAHAVAAAHNLLAAFVGNHLSHGNSLQLDPNAISWPLVMGLNDRELRQVTLQSGRRSQFRDHRSLGGDGDPRVGRRPARLAATARADSRGDDAGRPAGARRGPAVRRSHGRPPSGRHESQPGADHGGYAGAHPRRSLRQHRARFLTAVCGSMQLMPGLPKRPAGERVDVDPETGRIVGLT